MDDKEQFKVLAEAFTFWVICVGRAIKEGGSTNLDVRHDEAYRAAAGVIDALDNIPEKE